MSDEQRKEEEAEVEGHVKHAAHDEPAEEIENDDVEAHVRHSNVRHSNVRHT
jgi:SAM-dependent MidA family methyltransferase